jgi:hypothetical protein
MDHQGAVLAAQHFAGCEAHRRETAALFLALEQMHGTSLPQLNLDVTIGELLPQLMSREHSPHDSLEAVELRMAVEEELGQQDLAKLAVRQLADESVLTPLLGVAAESTQWDASTVWVRSVRGIINERVRHSGGCTCAEAPSNNKMQRTSHGQDGARR